MGFLSYKPIKLAVVFDNGQKLVFDSDKDTKWSVEFRGDSGGFGGRFFVTAELLTGCTQFEAEDYEKSLEDS